MLPKLSFKINRPTGAYSSFYQISIDIKADKKIVGSIGWQKYLSLRPDQKDGMKVSLRVKDNSGANPNCNWKNIALKQSFEGMGDREQGEKAKEWVKTNWEEIVNKFELSPEE